MTTRQTGPDPNGTGAALGQGQASDRLVGPMLLVRHAETQLNVERRFRGRADPPLSVVGERQAEALAIAFDAAPPISAVSSPRRRARQTAGAIAARHAVAMSIDERLDDLDYGACTGLTPEEARARWPREVSDFFTDPAGVSFPGGESVLAAAARAWALLASLASAPHLGRVALVTHDVIIRLVVCRVLGAPVSAIHHMSIDLASITALGRTGAELTLDWLNATTERSCVGYPVQP